jgi:hypothetical protein
VTDPDLTPPPPDDRLHQPGWLAAFRTRRRRAMENADIQSARRHEESAARAAYDRGRRDERARRHRSPLLGFVVLLVALAGGAMIYLAAREGSFSAGGQVMDNALGQASSPARDAANRAGDALEQAGQSLKNGAGQSQPPPRS